MSHSDDSEMSSMRQWNVDDGSQHSNDENHWREKNHRHLILVARTSGVRVDISRSNGEKEKQISRRNLLP